MRIFAGAGEHGILRRRRSSAIADVQEAYETKRLPTAKSREARRRAESGVVLR
jgi:hypothetical protein